MCVNDDTSVSQHATAFVKIKDLEMEESQQTWVVKQSSSRSRQQIGAWTLWSGFSTGSQQNALLQELQGKSRP